MSEGKGLRERLDEELEEVAQGFLAQIHGYDIVPHGVEVSKTPHDGLAMKITFGTLVREEYVWEVATLTPLEQQVRLLAEDNGFDFGHLVSAGSGDGYTDWSSLYLGTLVGGAT